MFQANHTEPSFVGREAAFIVSAGQPSLRTVEARARASGYDVTKSSLARVLTTRHDEPRRPNANLVGFAVQEFATELAVIEGYPLTARDIDDARDWFALNHIDALLNRSKASDSIWQRDETLARMILAKPTHDRPMSTVVRASAELHLSRNKRLSEEAREAARQRALAVLEPFIDMGAAYEYGFLSLASILGPRETFHSQAETDLAGVLFSTALNLWNQARGAEEDAEWHAHLHSLNDRGLLPQLAVRGVFFAEPAPLLNTAEAYWLLDEPGAARALVEATRSIEPKLASWLAAVGRHFYEAGFVDFVNDRHGLSPTDRIRDPFVN